MYQEIFSLDNPFFLGYLVESECSFESIIDRIKNNYGATIKAQTLTRELEQSGIDIKTLTKEQLQILDNIFNCI